MKKTHRQMIDFTEPQRAWMFSYAKRFGISVAEVVRRAMDAFRKAK